MKKINLRCYVVGSNTVRRIVNRVCVGMNSGTGEIHSRKTNSESVRQVLPSVFCIASSVSFNWYRARLSRLRTVPIEISRMSAIVS